MSTKHTPGPWTVHHKMRDCVTFDGRDGMENLFLCNVDGYYACQSEADARLIAAAPELLATLQNLLGVLEQVSLESGICCCGDSMKNHASPMYCGHSEVDSGEYYGQMAIGDAQKAIAKATGEQS